MGYVRYELDEEYPFNANGGRLEIPVYGEAFIKYRSPDDWWLEELLLSASNGKSGHACRSWQQPISKGSAFFLAIAEYLDRDQRERITNMIRADQRDQYESRMFDEGKERAKLRLVQ